MTKNSYVTVTDPLIDRLPSKGANSMPWILPSLLFIVLVAAFQFRRALRANARLYRRCLELQEENRRLTDLVQEQHILLAEQSRQRPIRLPVLVVYGRPVLGSTITPN